jgi:hypothetical protein
MGSLKVLRRPLWQIEVAPNTKGWLYQLLHDQRGGRRPKGFIVNAMNSINDGDFSVAGNSVSSINGAGTGDNT